MRVRLVVLLNFVLSFSFAQTHYIDSLKSELGKENLPDTIKGFLYKELAWEFMSHNLNTAIENGKKSIFYYNKGGNKIGLTGAYNNLGIAYKNKGQYDSAIIALKRSLEFSTGEKLADGYLNLGTVYARLPDYSSAVHYYLEALKIYERSGSLYDVSTVYNNLSIIYNDQKNKIEAFKYAYKAIEAYPSPNSYLNIGNYYLEERKFDSARFNYKRGYSLAKRTNNKIASIAILANIGRLYRYELKLDSAESIMMEVIVRIDSVSMKYGQLFARNELSEIYLLKGDYPLAIKYAKQALEMNSISTNIEQKISSFDILSRAYFKSGDFRKAYLYHENYSQLKDSVFNQQSLSSIRNLNTNYEIEKKENEIKILATQNEVRELLFEKEEIYRNILIGGIIILIVGMILVGYNLKIKSRFLEVVSKKNREIELQHTRIEYINKILELKTLRAQINPHFIFNSLTSIQNYIIKNDTDNAFAFLNKFSKLIRRVLENSMILSITLKEEVEMLRNYIELEQARFSFTFRYKVEVSEFLNMEKITLPYLLIQPYVENSILHGLRYKENGEGWLEITFEPKNDFLFCIIDDNGIGRKAALAFKKPSNNPHKSVGMSITNERIAKIAEITNQKVMVSIIDKEDLNGASLGTRVEILIPVQSGISIQSDTAKTA